MGNELVSLGVVNVLIRVFFSLQILEKPNYPKSICYVCLYKLEMWKDFKSQFLKTNKTLLTHFKVVNQSV